MDRHHDDYRRNDRYFERFDIDTEWPAPRRKRGRKTPRHARLRPYDEYSRNKRADWFEDDD